MKCERNSDSDLNDALDGEDLGFYSINVNYLFPAKEEGGGVTKMKSAFGGGMINCLSFFLHHCLRMITI